MRHTISDEVSGLENHFNRHGRVELTYCSYFLLDNRGAPSVRTSFSVTRINERGELMMLSLGVAERSSIRDEGSILSIER